MSKLMWFLSIGTMVVVLIPFVMLVVSMLVMEKSMSNDGFECGFDSFNVSVLPVSMRFFIFCIIFLILDLELIIMSLGPWVLSSSGFILNIVVFLIIITVSLLLEWLFGSLSWVE